MAKAWAAAGIEPYPQDVGTVVVVVEDARVGFVVLTGDRIGDGLASMTTRSSSPSQASARVPTRNSSSIGWSSGATSSSSWRGDSGDVAAAPARLVEQLLEPLGEGRDLHLLERDADHPAALPLACR